MTMKNTFRSEADRLQKLLAQSVERERLLRHALGDAAIPSTSVSPQKERLVRNEKDDMFVLPPLPDADLDTTASSLDQSSSSQEECSSYKAYSVNLQTIDVTSKHFLSLPADVRHEILTDIKAMRKESSWGRLHELPEESHEFSGFQMQRLLNRRKVQVSLEEAEQEMGGKSMSFREIEKLLCEDGIVDPNTFPMRRVISDEDTRYLHVRNLKKAMREEERMAKKEEEDEEACSPPKKVKLESDGLEDIEEEDEDEQLQRAIQMSLQDCQVMDSARPSSFVPKREIKNEIHEISDDESACEVSSNADSDLIEVPEIESDSSPTLPSQISFELNIAAPPDASTDFRHEDLKLLDGLKAKPFEVLIDPDGQPSPGDDLFADVFGDDKNHVDKAESHMSFPDEEDNLEDVKLKVDPTVVPKSPGQLMSILNQLDAEMDSLVKKESISIDVEKSKIKASLHHTFDEGIGIIESSSEDEDPSALNTENSEKSKHDITSNTNENISLVVQNELIKPNFEETKNTLNTSTIDLIEIDDNEDDDTSETSKQTKKLRQQDIAAYIKVTPTKVKSIETNQPETTPPKVASPFFRKKTPKSSSSSKKKLQTDNTSHADCTAKKSLFADPPESDLPLKSHAEIVQEVATELRNTKTAVELTELAEESRQNTRDLLMERNKQDRLGSSITDRMSDDCKRLLRMFGIPFVSAPMEAEAQCAYLDAADLTDGTITDDSDIWLFGGRTVYKHFFNQDKSVKEFKSDAVKRLFNVERSNLIQMAMLVGSDYTTGVAGIGTVTALEILSTFTTNTNRDGVSACNEKELLSTLTSFKEWLSNKVGSNVRLRTKLKNVTLAADFPSSQVVQSYLFPTVNDKLNAFSWRAPDTETLREFAKTTFGWTFSKTDETLQPVLKRMQEKKSQLSIRNYFASQGVIDRKEIVVSKRVRKAIDQMANPSVDGKDDETSAVKEKPKRVRKPKTINTTAEASEEPKRSGRVPRALPSTSSGISSSPQKLPRIPDFKPPIRQRVMALKEQQEIKAKAIAAFKKSQKSTAKKPPK